MLTLSVSKEASNQTLLKFLSKSLDIPQNLLYKLFRKKEIKVNGHWENADYIVREFDEIKVFGKDIKLKDCKKNDKYKDYILDIVFENEDVLVINKPAEILSQSDGRNVADINTIIKSKIGSKSGFSPSITNRLDRNTSGLITVGKTYQGLNELSKIFREKNVNKFYETIVEGKLDKSLHERAKINRDGLVSKISDVGSDIETLVNPISYLDNFTICKVQILTGKTHQIRAHLSSLGYPIVGDIKYGAKRNYKGFVLKHHLLHCECMVFSPEAGCGLANITIKAKRTELFDNFIKHIRETVR